MLTKESYMKLSKSTPFKEADVEGLGSVGILLFVKGERERISEFELDKQVAEIIRDENGERVFKDEDISTCISTMPEVTKTNLIRKALEVNGVITPQSEIKKN